MKTDVLTPLQVFNLPQRLAVPLFQRKYVWSQADQWEPLWDDIRRLAELRLKSPGVEAQHFLGAVVLQEQSGRSGALPEWTVIDGQQRLTTLQLIFDAAGAAMEARGLDKLARRLDKLTTNSEDDSDDPDDRLKVLPTNRDRAAFHEVMNARPPIDYTTLAEHQSLIVRAHQYFGERVEEWISDAGSTSDTVAAHRADQLVHVLRLGLQLVIVTLDRDDDAQEIFETLNARGTPLTAADLIKNYVFRKIDAEGSDTERAYHDHWMIFEDPFWEKEISVGRYFIARSSLFLNQWLVAQVGEEVGPRATFTRFKHFVDHEFDGTMLDLVSSLHRQAQLYQRWSERSLDPHADLGPIELFMYRTAEFEFVKPALLWVGDVDAPLPAATASAVVAEIESWVMRRALLGLSNSDLGRIVADLIRIHRPVRSDIVAERVTDYLSQLDRASTFWPGDEIMRRELSELPAYRRIRRGRLRRFLEAAEDFQRGFAAATPAKASNRVPRGQLQIEHILPQQWRLNWPVDGLTAEISRDEHVHRLGNLTLITGSLNAAVSNGPWLGANGKRDQLDRYDTLLVNRWIKRHGAQGWDETTIDQRTDLLIDALLGTWPVPDGHVGVVADPLPPTVQNIELKQLIAAGLLSPGTMLVPRSGTTSQQAEVLDDGNLQIGPNRFSSPSGAARSILQRHSNGWTYWQLTDGTTLAALRDEYVADKTEASSRHSSLDMGQTKINDEPTSPPPHTGEDAG
ncbi:GmrSD restriction endonuclease domain-containing protein [Nakamurella lactea]|uniref:GmrSD restriction endonuclease domain-containing protein n=1 Tax=Nakamurella lactea TaxID=459515 RepID=UPI00042355F2|nr:DUF262 domain-containing protein [Nakamurella lactea]